jgi:hypothetical protein
MFFLPPYRWLSFSLHVIIFLHSIPQSHHFRAGGAADRQYLTALTKNMNELVVIGNVPMPPMPPYWIPLIFQLPLNAHLPTFAEKFPSGADRQEIAQQLLIFFWGSWRIHSASFEKNLHRLALWNPPELIGGVWWPRWNSMISASTESWTGGPAMGQSSARKVTHA